MSTPQSSTRALARWVAFYMYEDVYKVSRVNSCLAYTFQIATYTLCRQQQRAPLAKVQGTYIQDS